MSKRINRAHYHRPNPKANLTKESMERWLKIGGEWSVFELLKPSQEVINDVMPRVRDAMTPMFGGYADYTPDRIISMIIKKSWSVPLSLLVKGFKELDVREGLQNDGINADQIIQSGLADRTFTTNFLTFHRPIVEFEEDSITPEMLACLSAYKLFNKDLKVTEDELRAVLPISAYHMVIESDKWRLISMMYILAYFYHIINEKDASIKKLEEQLAFSLKQFQGIEDRAPEVKVVEKQVGKEKLQRAVAEAATLRDELDARSRKIEHDLREEYQKQLDAKDERIRELEEQLAVNITYADTEDTSAELELPEIPTDNVCVVGGLPIMQKQLSAQFPNWIMCDTLHSVIPDSIEYLFVLSRFTAHTLVWRAKSQCPNAQVIYTSSTNIHQMLTDFRYNLW